MNIRILGLALVLTASACASVTPLTDEASPDPTETGADTTLDADVISDRHAASDGNAVSAGGSDPASDAETAPDTDTASDAGSQDPVIATPPPPELLAAASRWSEVRHDIPATTGSESATDYGAIPNDGESDSTALATAVAAAAASGGVTAVDLPAGEFELTRTLELPSGVVLRGQGQDTTLVIDLAGRDQPGLRSAGGPASGWTQLQDDVTAGSATIDLQGAPNWRPGQVVELEQDNVESMYTRSEWRVDWGRGSIGELGRVASVDGTRVTLAAPLLSSYQTDARARVRAIDAVVNVGLESLRVTRRDDGYGNTILFSFAADIWLNDVVSTRTTRAHVALDQVLHCRVGSSAFHGANDYGDGGRAYGISLARHTTGCAVFNNTLYDLRHAIIMQLGTSGNVIAYNDARGSAGYADRQPRADLSLHGHWPQANLLEGNVFDRVVFADWWGPSGPGNTLFRSCALDHVIVTDHSNDQLVVGNIVGPGGLQVDSTIDDLLSFANRSLSEQSEADLRSDAAGLPASLWLDSRPDFLTGVDWPPIGAADGPEQCRLPASARSPFS